MILKIVFVSVNFQYRLYSKHLPIFIKYNSTKSFKFWSTLRYPIIPFKLADIGEGIKEVTVKECFVKLNQKLNQFDDVCEVESDKASVKITSRFDGYVKNINFKEGDVIPVGSTLLYIETEEIKEKDAKIEEEAIVEELSENAVEIDKTQLSDYTGGNQIQTTEQSLTKNILITPAVRRIAKEYQVDLKKVKSTGKNGRITKEDVLVYLNQPSKVSEPVFANNVGLQPITGYRKVMMRTMTESNRIPTLTLSDEINVSNLETLRKSVKKLLQNDDVKVTLLAFVVKAISLALERYPILNSILEYETITYLSSHNIGIAVDTEAGLVVPNIKNVQRLSIRLIAKEIQRLQQLAIENKLSLLDTANGTFTISNIGSIAGTVVKPLILPPQVAIVGIGRIRTLPRFNENDQIEKCSIINVSWAADHRIIDGGTIARFSNLVKRYVENPGLLVTDA
ncbi:hypothetical protein PGB90_003229 [Kerria lacca]